MFKTSSLKKKKILSWLYEFKGNILFLACRKIGPIYSQVVLKQ